MSRYRELGILVIISLLCFILEAEGTGTEELRTVGVLPFENVTGQEEDAWLRTAIPEHVVTGLLTAKSVLTERLSVVERLKINQALEELGGILNDPETAKRAGRLVAADVVVIGSYEHVGDNINISGRFVDVESGIVTHAGQVLGSMKDILRVLDNVAYSIINSEVIRLIAHVTKAEEDTIRVELRNQQKPTVRFYQLIWNGETAQTSERKRMYLQAAAEEDSSTGGRIVLAKLYYANKEYDHALSTFRAVATSSRYSKMIQFQAHLGLGDTYAARGLRDDAIIEYTRALKIYPNDPDAHLKLARVYFERASLKRAFEEYTRVLELRPRDVDAHLGLAAVYFEQGEIDEAVTSAERAVSLSEGNSRKALYAIAKYCALSGRREEAVSWLRALLQKGFRDYGRLRSDRAFEHIPVEHLIEEIDAP